VHIPIQRTNGKINIAFFNMTICFHVFHCLHYVLNGHTNLFCLFIFLFQGIGFVISEMSSSKKKLTIKWLRTAITSSPNLQARDAGLGTPSRGNESLIEDSSPLPLGDSPGPDGLGALSLDSPKRKAGAQGESTPSSGKVKLRKLSSINSEHFLTSKVHFYCKSCSTHVFNEVFYQSWSLKCTMSCIMFSTTEITDLFVYSYHNY